MVLVAFCLDVEGRSMLTLTWSGEVGSATAPAIIANARMTVFMIDSACGDGKR